MEMAILHNNKEMMKILKEYKEIPEDVKPLQLSMLMSDARTAAANNMEGDEENIKREFQEILHSLSSAEKVKEKSIVIGPTTDSHN